MSYSADSQSWRDEVSRTLGKIEANTENLRDDVAALKKTVEGNGQPGHSQRIKALEDTQNQNKGKVGVLERLSSPILGGAGGFIAYWLRAHFGGR